MQVLAKASGRKDPDLPYVGLEHLAQGKPFLVGVDSSLEYVGVNSIFQANDILFGKLRPNLRKCVQVKFNGYCSTDILVLRPRPGVVPEFAAKVLQSDDVFDEAIRTAEGTKMPRTSWDKLKAFPVFVPCSSEQCRIAAVLDAVDAAIQRTNTVINKLTWMKAGLLNDLVTCGIDGSGQLRDPLRHPERFEGKGHFGIFPKAWTVEPLKEVLDRIDAGKSPTCASRPAAAGEWGVIKVSAIRLEGFRFVENKAVMSAGDINHAYEINDGDLLISRANTYELVGLTCLVRNPPSNLMLSDKSLRLHAKTDRTSSEYLAQITQHPLLRSQIEIEATGTSGSMKNISQRTIGNLLVPLPQLEEQKVILQILNAHDSTISAEESQREKLLGIKKALMHDLLTGHVPVSARDEEVVAA